MLPLSSPVYSSPVKLNSSSFPLNISQSLQYLEDMDGEFTPDQVIGLGNAGWKQAGSNSINFGYTQSVYWFRFSIEDSRNVGERLLLEINFPTLDYVDFYYPDGRGGYAVTETGDRRIFSSREVNDSNFVFSLKPLPGGSTCFLKIKTDGSFRFRAKIFTENTFLEDRNLNLPLFWLLYGIVIFTAVFYFFMFLYLRDSVYFYFSLFNFNIFLYQLSLKGFASQFLWPGYPGWGNIAPLLLTCTLGVLSALFLRDILNTRSTNRFLHYGFSFFGLFVFPLLAVLSLVLSYHAVALARYYTILLYGILIIPSSAYYLKRGNRFAVYFLAAFVMLMLTNVVTTLMALGVLPSIRFTEWINDAGFVIIILFSSLGLVDRFKVMTDDLHASRKSIDEKNRMLILANEELAATNEELESINEEFEAQNRELINSEKALIISEMELKEIFNSTNDAFIIFNPEGRILDVNNRMLEMYGVSRKQALALNINDITSPDNNPGDGYRILRRVIDGEELMIEMKALHPANSTEFEVEVGLKKLKWRDSDVILASIRDLSDRRAAEAERELVRSQLVQAQKMEAVGTLAGGIAHDFNNVLGGIIGSLDLINFLVKKEQPEYHEELTQYLETAIDSSARAADMTRQLLTLSRKSEMKMKTVILQDSLKQVYNICRNSFPKSVDLDFTYPEDRPLPVLADPSQIDQALLNLCVNASHAMTIMRDDGSKQGGTLALDVRTAVSDQKFRVVHPDAVIGITYIVISIRDTGVGIHEDLRARIFEPFFTTKPHDMGTGLGLAMTYGIISQHGGYITVDSVPGSGSVFTVYLPMLEQEILSGDEVHQGIVSGSGLILVIDDEEAILRVTAGILKKCGYDVLTACGPEPGIDIFRREKDRISAVILDNAMPGMSGIEVFGILKSIVPDVRVILCSGFIDDVIKKKAVEIGIVELINKPYSFEELSNKIKYVTGS